MTQHSRETASRGVHTFCHSRRTRSHTTLTLSRTSHKASHALWNLEQRQRKGKEQWKRQERFHKWRALRRTKICWMRTFPLCENWGHTRCFDNLVNEASVAYMYSVHRWSKVHESEDHWIPGSRSVCEMDSHLVPNMSWSIVCLFGTHNAKLHFSGRQLPDHRLIF